MTIRTERQTARYVGGPLHGQEVAAGKGQWARFRGDDGRTRSRAEAERAFRAGRSGYVHHLAGYGFGGYYIHATAVDEWAAQRRAEGKADDLTPWLLDVTPWL